MVSRIYGMYKIVLAMGFVLLSHAAYSAVQYRSFLRVTEQQYNTLPMDIILQSLLACLLCGYGIVKVSGDFKHIDSTAELNTKSFESLNNRTNFMIFNHRGRKSLLT